MGKAVGSRSCWDVPTVVPRGRGDGRRLEDKDCPLLSNARLISLLMLEENAFLEDPSV